MSQWTIPRHYFGCPFQAKLDFTRFGCCSSIQFGWKSISILGFGINARFVWTFFHPIPEFLDARIVPETETRFHPIWMSLFHSNRVQKALHTKPDLGQKCVTQKPLGFQSHNKGKDTDESLVEVITSHDHNTSQNFLIKLISRHSFESNHFQRVQFASGCNVWFYLFVMIVYRHILYENGLNGRL